MRDMDEVVEQFMALADDAVADFRAEGESRANAMNVPMATVAKAILEAYQQAKESALLSGNEAEWAMLLNLAYWFQCIASFPPCKKTIVREIFSFLAHRLQR